MTNSTKKTHNLHNLALQVVTSSWSYNQSRSLSLCGHKRCEVNGTHSSCLLCPQQTVEQDTRMFTYSLLWTQIQYSQSHIFCSLNSNLVLRGTHILFSELKFSIAKDTFSVFLNSNSVLWERLFSVFIIS